MSESIYKALTYLGPCQISMNKIGKNFSLEGIHDLATAELVLQLSYSFLLTLSNELSGSSRVYYSQQCYLYQFRKHKFTHANLQS